jgi:hypothetical protein
VAGGEEVFADRHAEGDQTAGLDLVGVRRPGPGVHRLLVPRVFRDAAARLRAAMSLGSG